MENLLSIDQAAEKLGLSAFFVRRRIKDGSLESVKLGRNTIRISEESLAAFVASRNTTVSK